MLTLDELIRRRKFLVSRLRAIQLKRKKEQDKGKFGVYMTDDLYGSIQEVDFLIQYIKMKSIKGI